MRLIIGLFTVLIAIIIAIALSQGYFKDRPLPFMQTTTAAINTHTFKITKATSDKDRQVGLSGRTSLASDAGMLFVFDKPDYYAFWMKEMKFPIDIIYIKDNRIVTIYRNVQPPKSKEENPPVFKPEEPADAVLEINAGLSQKYNFKKGDEVKIKN